MFPPERHPRRVRRRSQVFEVRTVLHVPPQSLLRVQVTVLDELWNPYHVEIDQDFRRLVLQYRGVSFRIVKRRNFGL